MWRQHSYPLEEWTTTIITDVNPDIEATTIADAPPKKAAT
jgi:hypothetical protein